MDCNLPGSSVRGIFQARLFEWVAISFSKLWIVVAIVQLLSYNQLFATPWTAVCQGSLSFTMCLILLKLMSIESVMHPTISSSFILFFSCLRSFPASGSFPMNWQWTSCGQSIGVLPSVLPMSIQSWFPLRLTGLISLLSKGFSRVFSSTTVQKHQCFSILPSLWSSSDNHTWLLKRS